MSKSHYVRAFFTVTQVEFLCIIFYVAALLSLLCLISIEPIILKLSPLVEEEVGQYMWRAHFAEKTAKMFQRRFDMLNRFTASSEISINVFNTLNQPASLSIELLQLNQ